MTKERLTSLDVFRGITIMLMTIVNNPGSWGGHLSSIGTRPVEWMYSNRFSFSFFHFYNGNCSAFCNAKQNIRRHHFQ